MGMWKLGHPPIIGVLRSHTESLVIAPRLIDLSYEGMLSMKLKLLALSGLLAASAAASATTTDWGAHDPAEIGTGFAVGANASIDDTFMFSLTTPASVVAVSVANDGAGGVFDLTGGTVMLYQVGNSTPIDTFAFDSTAFSHNFGALNAGNYYYEVMAKVAPTAQAGSYLLSSTLAPVPEPESYALLMAGLSAMAFIARRRRG